MTIRLPVHRGWKAVLRELPVREPDLILPATILPNSIHQGAKYGGMRVLIRKRGNEYHVWRVK